MAATASIRLRDNNQLINSNAFEHDFSAFGYTGYGKAVEPIYGPSYRNLDISFIKDTHITERLNFRFQANFFNTFNSHYFLNQGDTNGGTGYAFVTDVAASGNSFGTWNGHGHHSTHHPVCGPPGVLES